MKGDESMIASLGIVLSQTSFQGRITMDGDPFRKQNDNPLYRRLAEIKIENVHDFRQAVSDIQFRIEEARQFGETIVVEIWGSHRKEE